MGSILLCPCKTVAKIFSPSKNFGTVFCCIPLSLFALICSILLIGWGSYEIQLSVRDKEWATFNLVLLVIIASLKCLMGLFGIFAALFRYAPGASCLVMAYKVLTASIILSFIITWIYWIIELAQGTKYYGSDNVTTMVVYTVLHLLFFAASWWIISCFASLNKVLSVGGTGWENMNWKEVVGEQATDDY